MQRCLVNIVFVLLLAALLGCDAPPTAPSSSPPLPPSPFAKLVGQYALAIELDETCAEFPQALRVRTYDAEVMDPIPSHHYAILWVVGEDSANLSTSESSFPRGPLNLASSGTASTSGLRISRTAT